ncbi:MAG: aminotransferase class I/II-fold pyridoxal phosphate-dependent enzyme [Candidatus Hydrothermarchaeales archaeon]
MNQRHGGEVWDYETRPIDFSANINPLGPSRLAIKAIEKWKIEYYPPQDLSKLKAAIADYAGVKEKNVVLGNGSVGIIKDFCSIFLKRSENTLILQPTFSEYERYSLIYGKEAKRLLPKRGLEHTAKEIIKAVDKYTRIIFLCCPNNPTGSVMAEGDLDTLIQFCWDNDIFVFLDEVFIEFSSLSSYVPMVEEYRNLFVLRSLTKFFALPALRVGYGIGSPDLIRDLEAIKTPWNINTFAHDAAIASLKDKSYIKRTKKFIDVEKRFLTKKIEELGIKVYESNANFLLLRYNWNSKQVKNWLLKEGILIRDCSTFPGLDTRFIRVGVRRREDNMKLISALKRQVLQGVKTGRDCEYYPCHFKGQDCTFCFCPFYPCLDEKRGKFIVGKKEKRVWTCKDCNNIHNQEIVERILALLGEKRMEELDPQKQLEVKSAAMELLWLLQ